MMKITSQIMTIACARLTEHPAPPPPPLEDEEWTPLGKGDADQLAGYIDACAEEARAQGDYDGWVSNYPLNQADLDFWRRSTVDGGPTQELLLEARDILRRDELAGRIGFVTNWRTTARSMTYSGRRIGEDLAVWWMGVADDAVREGRHDPHASAADYEPDEDAWTWWRREVREVTPKERARAQALIRAAEKSRR